MRHDQQAGGRGVSGPGFVNLFRIKGSIRQRAVTALGTGSLRTDTANGMLFFRLAVMLDHVGQVLFLNAAELQMFQRVPFE
jgi:hypothetical protein